MIFQFILVNSGVHPECTSGCNTCRYQWKV